MKRSVVFLSVCTIALACGLGGLVPASASALTPASAVAAAPASGVPATLGGADPSSLVINVTSTSDPSYPHNHQMAFDSANSTTSVPILRDTQVSVGAYTGLAYGGFDFDLQPPTGQKLHVGTYTGVNDTDGYDPDNASLRVSLGSNGVPVQDSEVEIRDLAIDASGAVTRLDLVFRLNPARPANSLFGSIRFGQAEKPGRTLSAHAISWPMSPVGAPRVLATESIHNTGSAPLNLGTAAVTGVNSADFTLTADSCSGRTLLPGQACPVVIGFTPTAAGRRTATLNIPINGETDTVELGGEAPPGFSRIVMSGNDYVSGGLVHDYLDGPHQLQVKGNRQRLIFQPTKVYDYEFSGLQVWLSGAGNQPMTLGEHPAADYFSNSLTEYGIYVSGLGRGCGTSGSVNLKQLTYAPDGTLLTADIAFTQHCNGDSPADVMKGEIKWRLPVAPTPPADTIAPTVSITGRPAALTGSSSASFSFTGADGRDPVSSLRYLCSLDGAAATPCTSPRAYAGLSSASHTFTVRVTDRSGNSTLAADAWRVDRVAPSVAMTAPATLYGLTTSLAPSWSAKDVGGGLANVDVRWQRAAWNGGFTAAVYPAAWQKTIASKTTLAGVAPGYTYCFSARARDKAGNVSAWSAPRCTAVALDDRSLVASTGWTRATGSAFYRSTATATSRSAVTLTRTGVQAKRIYLVATRCSTCGTVGVYWNGVHIKNVSLYASSTIRRSVLGITTFTSVRSGTLTIRTLTSKKTVQIDGLALVRG